MIIGEPTSPGSPGRPGRRMRRGAMAREYLRGHGETPASASENYLVNVHVEQSALVDGEGRASLPIESVRRIARDARKVTIVESDKDEPLSVGRRNRAVPSRIKRALRARDGGCVFPGCRNSRFVDAHHVQHWSAGGETSLENLVLLCSRHHRLVHEGGYRIEKDFRDRWMFRRPDGIAVPACGYRVQDVRDEGTQVEIKDLEATPRSCSRASRKDRVLRPNGPIATPPG